MVAIFINRNSSIYLVSCLVSEFIGRFALFSWALTHEWGTFMHLIWSLIYCMCLVMYWVSLDSVTKKTNLTIIFTVILILFQIIMALDCKWSDGNVTFLYSSYKYVIVLIHCCIVSTFIEWGNIIRTMDEFSASIRGVISINGYCVLFWYTDEDTQIKKSQKR